MIIAQPGGYRGLRRGSHGMKPNFVLPANYIIRDGFIGDNGARLK